MVDARTCEVEATCWG